MMRIHTWANVWETQNIVLKNNLGNEITMILAMNSLNVILCEAIVRVRYMQQYSVSISTKYVIYFL